MDEDGKSGQKCRLLLARRQRIIIHHHVGRDLRLVFFFLFGIFGIFGIFAGFGRHEHPAVVKRPPSTPQMLSASRGGSVPEP